MKTLFITLLMLLNLNLWANESLKYSIDEDSLINPSITNAYLMKEHFEAYGLFSLTNTPLVKNAQVFDFLYANDSLKKFVTIKSGLAVESRFRNVLYKNEANDQYVLHLKSNNISYVVMFFHFTDDEVLKLSSRWVKEKVTFSFLDLFISKVHASDMCLANGNMFFQKSILDLSRTANKVEDDSVTKLISKCAFDAVKGIQSSANDTLGLFKTLITNPKKLWNETSQSVKALSLLVQNLNVNIKAIAASLNNVSPTLKSELICMMAGTGVGAIVSSIIAGPAAIARAIPVVTLKLKNIADQINKIESLKSKGVNLKEKDKHFKEVVACGI